MAVILALLQTNSFWRPNLPIISSPIAIT